MKTSESSICLYIYVYLAKKDVVKHKKMYRNIKFSSIQKCGHAKICSCNLIYLHCLCYKSSFHHLFNRDFIEQTFTNQKVYKGTLFFILQLILLAFHAGSVHVRRFYVLQNKNTSMPHNFCCSIGPSKIVFGGFRFRGWGWLNNLYNTFINITQRLWQTSERISIITFLRLFIIHIHVVGQKTNK